MQARTLLTELSKLVNIARIAMAVIIETNCAARFDLHLLIVFTYFIMYFAIFSRVP